MDDNSRAVLFQIELDYAHLRYTSGPVHAKVNTTAHSRVTLTSSSFYIHVAWLPCPGTCADVFGNCVHKSLVRGCGGLRSSFDERETFSGGQLTSSPDL